MAMPNAMSKPSSGLLLLALPAFALFITWLYPSVAFAEPAEQSVVRLEVKTSAGTKYSTTAVRISSDALLAPCTTLIDATAIDAVTDRKRTALSVSGVAAWENVCKLTGAPTGAVATFASASAVMVGASLNSYTNTTSDIDSKIVTLKITRKLNGGRFRIIYFDGHGDIGLSLSTPTANYPLFTSTGQFVGFATAVPGGKDVRAGVVIEDSSRLQFTGPAPSNSTLNKASSKQAVPMALGPLRDKFGLLFAYADLASVYGRTRSFDKSVALAEKWKVEQSNNPYPFTIAAAALNRLKFLDQSAADIEKALALSPEFLPAHTAMVTIKNRQGRKTEAEIAAGKALAITASDGLDNAARVTLLRYLKRHDEALALAGSIMQLEPEASYARFAMCEAQFAAGKLDAAISACRSYLEKDPDGIGGWITLSLAYLRSGKLEDAFESSKRAVELGPDVPEAWGAVGVVSEAKGDQTRVSEAKARLAELDSAMVGDFEKTRRGISCVREAQAKAFSNAITECTEAIRLSPENASAQAALGFALLNEKRLDEGILAYERAVKINPKEKGYWTNLALAYSYKKDSGKTREAYEHLKAISEQAAFEVYPKIQAVLDNVSVTAAPPSEHIVADPSSGCRVYSYPDHTPRWSGGCTNGYADGPGTLTWIQKDGRLGAVYTGTMADGHYLNGKLTIPNGVTIEGNFNRSFHPNGYAVQTFSKIGQKNFPDRFAKNPGTYDSEGNYRVQGFWAGRNFLFVCTSESDCQQKRPL